MTELSALSTETRRFEPPAELAAHANVTADAYEHAAKDRLAWWEVQAGRLQWDRGWDQVLDGIVDLFDDGAVWNLGVIVLVAIAVAIQPGGIRGPRHAARAEEKRRERT